VGYQHIQDRRLKIKEAREHLEDTLNAEPEEPLPPDPLASVIATLCAEEKRLEVLEIDEKIRMLSERKAAIRTTL
jgi:hypothetical protein